MQDNVSSIDMEGMVIAMKICSSFRGLLFALIMTVCLAVSGCGNDSGGVSYNKTEKQNGGEYDSLVGTEEQEALPDEQNAEGEISDTASGNDGETVDSEESSESKEDGNISGEDSKSELAEKLIYRCNINMETINFDKTIAAFKENIDQAGGFVEREDYTNNGVGSSLPEDIYEDYERFNHAAAERHYSATIRIPSEKYNSFVDSTGKIGNVTSKDSNVTNVTTEYVDLQTEKNIYEAQQKRLIKQLENANDKLALQIETKLTDVQVHIAKLNNRLNSIDADVAYSTIVIEIEEVAEYQEREEETDTFLDRLKNTTSNSISAFLIVMEKLLMLFILIFPYLAVAGIIVLLCWKARKKKRAAIRQEITDFPAGEKETAEGETNPQSPEEGSDPQGAEEEKAED